MILLRTPPWSDQGAGLIKAAPRGQAQGGGDQISSPPTHLSSNLFWPGLFYLILSLLFKAKVSFQTMRLTFLLMFCVCISSGLRIPGGETLRESDQVSFNYRLN